jgi:hypothetical protein
MQFVETITAYSENYRKYINIHGGGKMQRTLTLKKAADTIPTELSRLKQLNERHSSILEQCAYPPEFRMCFNKSSDICRYSDEIQTDSRENFSA